MFPLKCFVGLLLLSTVMVHSQTDDVESFFLQVMGEMIENYPDTFQGYKPEDLIEMGYGKIEELFEKTAWSHNLQQVNK